MALQAKNATREKLDRRKRKPGSGSTEVVCPMTCEMKGEMKGAGIIVGWFAKFADRMMGPRFDEGLTHL